MRAQAFYLAEAGKEHMIQLAMDKVEEVATTIATRVPFDLPINKNLGSGSYSANAKISHYQGNQYLVEVLSTGQVSSLHQVARQTLLVTIVPPPAAGDFPSKWLLYWHDDGFERDPHFYPDMSKVGNKKTNGGFSYPPVVLPYADSSNAPVGSSISVNGNYGPINLSAQTLTITTVAGPTPLIIQVPSITLDNGARIVVKGEGQLSLYVKGNIKLGQECRLVETSSAVVQIYCAGDSITTKGKKDAPFMMQRTLLYAPGAHLLLDTHVKASGSLIVKSVYAQNHVELYYDSVFDDGNLPLEGYPWTGGGIQVEKLLWSPRLP